VTREISSEEVGEGESLSQHEVPLVQPDGMEGAGMDEEAAREPIVES
jgi:hypothetical protein